MGTGYTRNDTANNIADGNIINASDLDGEFDAIESAFNSSTGHTHDGTSAEGAPIEVVGPTQDVVVTASVMRPKTTNTIDLGTSSLLYKDAFIDGTATIGGIVIDDAGTIGSASDTDAIAIGSGGVVTFSQSPTVNVESATTNSTINTLILRAQSSGTPAVGIGTGMRFEVETAAGNVEQGAAIRAITTSLTPTDEEIDLVFYSMKNGSLAEAFRVDSDTDSLRVGDSIKVTFGASQDLQIYHDGSRSIIQDNGTGNLRIQANNLELNNADNSENYLFAANNGAVTLYYDNAAKIATTSTGVDVTGTLTADDITLSDADTPTITLTDTTNTLTTILQSGNSTAILGTTTNHDLRFYTNNSEAMRIDTSANVGIGTSSPNSSLEVSALGSSAGDNFEIASLTADFGSATTNDSFGGYLSFRHRTGGNLLVESARIGVIGKSNNEGSLVFYGGGGTSSFTAPTEKMRINQAGELLIAKTTNSIATAGTAISETLGVRPAVDGDIGLLVNRLTSNGRLIELRKDGTEFGQIGSRLAAVGSDIYIGHTTSTKGNIKFTSGPSVSPSTNAGAANDNGTDLGSSSNRFRDLYLGGDIKTTNSTLTINSGTANTVASFESTDTEAQINLVDTTGSAQIRSRNDLRFYVNGGSTRAADIDSSGNALFGKTSADNTTVGSVIYNGSGFSSVRDNSVIAVLNRLNGDGSIIVGRRDGNNGLVLGARDGAAEEEFWIGNGSNIGLRSEQSGADRIEPAFGSTGAVRDNAVDLGSTGVRFDDIYATNGTIQTSDEREKQQIASLTTSEIAAATAISKLFKTYKWNNSVAEKGDNARTHAGVVAQQVEAAMTAEGLDAGDYAFFISTTWWETQTEVPASDGDEANGIEAHDAYTRTDTYSTADLAPEGATERNRKGIRYPELLAFISAATEQRLTSIEARLDVLEG